METCPFCQLATRRSFARSTRHFQRCVPRISNFLMVFVILEHTVCFRCYVAAKRLHIPLNPVHLTPQMAEKVTPNVTSKLISVNPFTGTRN